MVDASFSMGDKVDWQSHGHHVKAGVEQATAISGEERQHLSGCCAQIGRQCGRTGGM
jgi:hypothetical protein